MYSTHNEKKIFIRTLIIKKFIRTLKNRNYNYITSISKNVYIDKLDDIVNKCNNTYHKTVVNQCKSKHVY